MQTEERQPTTDATAAVTASTTPALENQGMFRLGMRFGLGVFRLRWLIVVMWIAVLLASVPFASKIGTVLTGGGFTPQNSDAIRVADIAQQRLHEPVSQVQVVFHSDTIPVQDAAFQQELAAFTSHAQGFGHVTGVVPGGTGADGRTALLLVNFDQSVDALEPRLAAFHQLLPTDANQPANAYVTGDVAIYNTLTQVATQDTEKADAAALPIALLVLLVVFATIVAALMPLVLALVTVPVALAIVYFIAQHVTSNIVVLSIASIIGLGLSIDYSLFLVRRFREELAKGRPIAEAVGWTIATAGEAILFSGLTVLIGFAALLLINIPVMTSIGYGGAAVVLCAMLAALTLLPALLGLLGPRINALGIPFVQRFTANATRANNAQGFWHRLALWVMRRPVQIIIAVSVLLVALGWPIFSMRVGTPDYHSLPADVEARQGIDLLHAQFPATNLTPVYLIAQANDGSAMLSSTNLTKLATISQWLSQQPHITGVTSLMAPPTPPGSPALTTDQLISLYTSGQYTQNPVLSQLVTANATGNITLITAQSDTKIDTPAGIALVHHLRDAHAVPRLGLTVLVGGLQAITYDFNNELYGNFPKAILFILITTFLLLLVMFRSVLLPLKAVLMNVLSISAAFGVLVLIFQWGNLSSLLGFTSEGFVETTVPILLFCILFGLSMDYEVFLLSRIREEWLLTHNNRYAVAQGLEKTGGTITSAALILTIVTVAIATTSILATKETGVGMTVAILVDVTIIRSLLVPATMRLLGRWNWWLPGQPIPTEGPMPTTP